MSAARTGLARTMSAMEQYRIVGAMSAWPANRCTVGTGALRLTNHLIAVCSGR